MLLDCLIEFERITNTLMNVKKCKGPAKSMEILGILYDSKEKRIFWLNQKLRSILVA